MFEYMGILVALAKIQTGKGHSMSGIFFKPFMGPLFAII